MKTSPHVLLVPDCGPLLELHRRGQLHWLSLQFASLAIPDAVVHQLVRFHGEAGKALAIWISQFQVPVFQTRTFNNGHIPPDVLQPDSENTLVDLCLVEAMKEISAQNGLSRGLFLLDDYKCLGESQFTAIEFCTPITLGALERFIPPAPPAQEQALVPRPATVAPEEKPGTFRLNALQRANPEMLEKHFRRLAGQTAQLCMKGIDLVKAGKNRIKPVVPAGPGRDLVEQFRKKLDWKRLN